jgi:hypothetical protein
VKKTTGALTNYAGVAILLTGVSTRVDYGIINTTTGAVIRDSSSNINSITYSTQSYGDYWRVITTFTDNQSNLVCTFILYPAISTNGTSINSNAQGSNIFWGAQLEAGSYATSYIPTTSASVTRNADVISKTGISSLIGQTEGTLFLDFIYSGGVSNHMIINDVSYNSYIYFNSQNNNELWGQIQSVGIQFSMSATAGRYKMALAYKSGSSAMYVNGTQVGTSSTTFSLSGSMNILDISLMPNDPKQKRDIYTSALWKTRLTNTQLAQLTTI